MGIGVVFIQFKKNNYILQIYLHQTTQLNLSERNHKKGNKPTEFILNKSLS